LAIKEKSLGPNHPSVATTLNNLGQVFLLQHRYAEAEPLFRRALEIREARLGKEHPDVGTTLNDYASLLRCTNRKAEAKVMTVRANRILAKSQATKLANQSVHVKALMDGSQKSD
jgi:Tfp pilus assembly protein PilF